VTDPAGIAAAAAALTSARSVVLCGHVDPDGDAVGSVLGLTLTLRAMGVDAIPTLADESPPPAAYGFLPGFDMFRPVGELPVPDVFAALDTPTPARLGLALPLAQQATQRVIIDHHPDSACFLSSVCAIDATAAATGELVWELLPAMGVAADPDVATCLYTALVTDTGRFQYTNTKAVTLRHAADMIEGGADSHLIYRQVYETRSSGALALVGRTLSRMKVANGGAVAYSWIDQHDLDDCDVSLAETETLIDQVRQLRGVDVVFLVKCTGGRCRVSMRSKGAADVGEIARGLGGGGHCAAAGFTFHGDLPALLATLLPMLPMRA
jgi:bifunctional oligoribonuclease and PAP phosphatase NrnA